MIFKKDKKKDAKVGHTPHSILSYYNNYEGASLC